MELIPILHVQHGDPVVGRPGAWRPMPVPYLDGGTDLAELARHLFVRFGNVAVVDLGEGRTEDTHHNLYQKLSKQHVLPWVDARPRGLEDVLDLFVAGADRVVVRMDEMDATELEEVLMMADGEIWLGYAYRSPTDLDRQFKESDPFDLLKAGARGIVLIDLESAGTTRGVDASVLQRVPYENLKVVVAGGVRSVDDVEALRAAGAYGAMVATALYDDVEAFAALAKRYRGDGPAVDEPDSDKGNASVSFQTGSGFLPGVVPGRAVPEPDDGQGRT